jgi:MraZ protein
MYPEPAWPPIRDELLRVGAFDPQTARWKRLMIGFAEETEVDGSGRILISPELRKFAGIDRQVMMVGQGTHFEVWSVDRWEAEMAKLAEGDGKPPPGLENFAL